MAKHLYITNTDGGYFYRIYPKLSRLRFKPDDEKDVHYDLFNPGPSFDTSFKLINIYGKFITKYNEKGLMVELLAHGQFCITCLLTHTHTQENRILQSKIVINVPDEIYKYPFIKDRIYSISLTEVKDITP